IHRRRPKSERRSAWQRLIRRRNKAVRLIEELNLRTNRLQPLFEKLVVISDRMMVLSRQIREKESNAELSGPSIEDMKRELHFLMRITLESPATLRRRIAMTP